ncbi:MAG: L-aspartate oxidase [Lactobacillales bacterium]|jgi:L-aspartate oxidase|nr:L-aspartate oxidase [Lactobacillales bacterium]
MKKKVIILGSGIAATTVAFFLQDKCDVTIVTKGALSDNNSALAQGGVAAAVGPNDTAQAHYEDTLTAGAQLNDPDASQILVNEGAEIIRELIKMGVPFDRLGDGSIDYGMEGAHHHPRILHAGGDQTGKYVLEFLQRKLSSKVKIEANTTAVEIFPEDNKAKILVIANKQFRTIEADFLVIATGGIGQLFPVTSNDKTITGDGIALAKRAGAELADMEFIQFHPTLLNKPGSSLLISEAVRGDGARLVNKSGEYFMADVHPDKDLAPRFVVAREITNQFLKGEEVFLDISTVQNFRARFPYISRSLDKAWIDSTLIPVKPGAHFFMGGVKTDLNARTTLGNIYAVGEVARTGVHGANRLASNSLLEGLVFARRAAQDIIARPQKDENYQTEKQEPTIYKQNLPTLEELKNRAWESIGIIRRPEKIREFLAWLEEFDDSVPNANRIDFEISNLILISKEIARAALARPVSIGAHYIEEEND